MKVPNRWEKCPKRGQIVADRFIPFKTPLDSKYNNFLSESDRFHVETMIQNPNKHTVSMIIDLTKTTSYYNSGVVLDLNCQYLKIECEGFSEPPTIENVKAFMKGCREFFETHPNELIGVHCTHGFNRTGFLIISYLVEHEGWCLIAAYKAFCICRPPGIYKNHYLVELNKRYGNSEDGDMIPIDEELNPPDWDKENSCANEENSNEFYESKTDSKTKELLGVKSLDQDNLKTVRNLQAIFSKFLKSKDQSKFPGSQPLNIGLHNIHLLAQTHYKVSWKADGLRLMLLIVGQGSIYLVDRDFKFFPVGSKISFWHQEDLTQHLTNTILDGEMVMDKVQVSANQYSTSSSIDQGATGSVVNTIPRYLIYDIVVLNDKLVGNLDFIKRLEIIDHEIVRPRQKLISLKKLDRQAELFGVRAKPFYDIEMSERLLSQKFQQSLSHSIDGLIYQNVNQPYYVGKNELQLKWKPFDKNTLDFLLKIVVVSGPGKVPKKRAKLFLTGNSRINASSGLKNHSNLMHFSDMAYSKDLEQYENKIIECKWDFKNNTWQIIQVRKDKSHPNNILVATNIIELLKNPLMEQNLFEFIEKKGFRPISGKTSNMNEGAKMWQNDHNQLSSHRY